MFVSIDESLKKINTKFALTIVIAKRARQLQLNPDDVKVEHPVGHKSNEVALALEELYMDKLEYYLDRESMEVAQEKAMKDLEESLLAQQEELESLEVASE